MHWLENLENGNDSSKVIYNGEGRGGRGVIEHLAAMVAATEYYYHELDDAGDEIKMELLLESPCSSSSSFSAAAANSSKNLRKDLELALTFQCL